MSDIRVLHTARTLRASLAVITMGLAFASVTGCNTPGSGSPQLPAQCYNGVQDDNETGLDCGGPCLSCAFALCGNGVLDVSEADVDCGGVCAGCGGGKSCSVARDCASGNCDAGLCGDPAACNDGIKNGDETDLDCGGSCSGCGAGRTCETVSDCLSDVCEGNTCAEPESCRDGLQGPDESDVDCGGPCRACATNRLCDADPDCLSAVCVNGVCRDPSCSDTRRNQNETDVDCGGGCPDCQDGRRCVGSDDCMSGSCDEGRCVSCTDGIKNGDESGVDCGASCAPCQDGGSCTVDGDCSTGKCDRGFCCTPNACGACAALPTEVCDGIDNDCDGITDDPTEIGSRPGCVGVRGVCVGARSSCRGDDGWTCQESDFQSHSDIYEADEATCDGLDNDCDGLVDDGVTNACGRCGPVPVETCDGLDNDCDGQTDEIAQCAACSTTSFVMNSSTDSDSFRYLEPQAIALLPNQTAVIASDSGFTVTVETIEPTSTILTSRGTSRPARITRVGSDLFMIYGESGGANAWKAERISATGTSLRTWSQVFPFAYTVASIAGSSNEVLVLATDTDFDDENNFYQVHERRLVGTELTTSSLLGRTSDSFNLGAAIVDGTPVRLLIFNDGSTQRLRSLWGTSNPVNIVETSSSFSAVLAPDNKFHIFAGVPSQHFVGTNNSWARTTTSNEAPFGSMSYVGVLPTGEPVGIMTNNSSVDVLLLRNGRWTTKTIYTATAGKRVNSAGFVVDTYGRMHVAFTTEDDVNVLERSALHGLIACPRF